MNDADFKGQSLGKLYSQWLKSDEYHGLNPDVTDLDMDVAFIEWVLWMNDVPFKSHDTLRMEYRSVIQDKKNKDLSVLECIRVILEKEAA